MKTAYKAFRWFALISTVAGLVLLFKAPPRLTAAPQTAAAAAENAKSFESKLTELETAHQQGQTGVEAHVTSEEVSAALAESAPQGQVVPASTARNSGAELTPEQVPVQNTQVVFEGDQVKCQFTAQVYGKDIPVTLAGHLGARDGYATFTPTSFTIGSMPVPISMVEAQLQRKLSEPENREKMKLPDFISDLRIQEGQLVIVEK